MINALDEVARRTTASIPGGDLKDKEPSALNLLVCVGLTLGVLVIVEVLKAVECRRPGEAGVPQSAGR